MYNTSPNRLDKLTHQTFVSSLRTWCNEDETGVTSVVDKNLAWINDISSRLMVGSKVDLMKISTLDRLSKVEFDFLKVAIPNLTYFSKTYKHTPGYESSSLVLKKWAGQPVVVDNLSRASPNMFINRLKFKNIVLKLLMNPTNDKRIRRMQQFLLNPLEIESSVPPSLESSPVSSPKNFEEQQYHLVEGNEQSQQQQHNLQHQMNQFTCENDKKLLNNLSPSNRCVLTPNTCQLLDLVEEGKFPVLYIEYVEPTPGLFSTSHITSLPYKPVFKHGHKNCFLKNANDLDWEHSLRT